MIDYVAFCMVFLTPRQVLTLLAFMIRQDSACSSSDGTVGTVIYLNI